MGGLFKTSVILINNLHMVLEHTVILGGHLAPYFTDEDLSKIRHYVAERSTFDDDTSYIISRQMSW